MVYSLARNSLGNAAQAEELAQDVFLELFRNLNKIESPAHLTAWLRRTAMNRCIDHSRKWSTRTEVPMLERVEHAAPESTSDALLSSLLREQVALLPDWQRAVVVLRFQEDMDLSEIAETLAIPINTVKSRLHRALESLRGLLDQMKVARA